ncbi:GAF domain-containing protein [Rubellimicrobium arenae]|uniref:GAF domain-containing protein n=1 Tax=Rubellimicrobium arenae TaxID=2817372 RepID=UPI001B311FF1|nr:GAF domain-containing protein [Rubellimicrobium arenae]
MTTVEEARAALARAIQEPGQPEPAFAALAALVAAEIGARLFTVMTYDDESGLARRRWSNMPDAYPPGGTKPMLRDKWSEQVFDRQEPFVANDIGAIAEVFPDHPLIQSLGCESCLNLPVIVGGEVIGTLNCLDVAGHYTPERVTRAQEMLALPAAACLLIDRSAGDRMGERA